MIRFSLPLLLLCFGSLTLSAQADNYGAVEWDLFRIGYASPGQTDYIPSGYSVGIALGTEVRYNITDKISAGFRPEAAVYGSTDATYDSGDVGVAASFVLTGDYYLEDERSVRPFGGLGIGFYNGADVKFRDGGDIINDEFDVGSSLGIVPRIGVELGHFRVSAEYNLTFNDAVANYFSIMIAPTLFGGPR